MEYEPHDPIVYEFDLACTPERAFEAYTAEMGSWWHRDYTGSPDTFRDVTIGPRLGGQVTEQHTGGAEHDWGEVIGWEPGVRVAYTTTLAMNRAWPTIIRVGFAGTETGCHVTFEHGGWDSRNVAERERFGDWPVLLDRYQRYVTTGTPEEG